MFQKRPAIERYSSEGVQLSEIGIQVDLLPPPPPPPPLPPPTSSATSTEDLLKLKNQLMEMQTKQKKFAKLFDEAPPST